MNNGHRVTLIPVAAISIPSIAGAAVLALCLTLGVVVSTRGGAVGFTGAQALDAAGVLIRTLLVSISIGALATILALPGAWASRRLGTRWLILMAAPLLVPQYLVYAAWGLWREPGTRLGAMLEGSPAWVWQWIGHAQAVGGLALWAFPIGVVIIGASARRLDRESLDAMRQTRAGAFRRWCAVLAMLRPAILTSIGVVSTIMLGSAIPLHLARVETFTVVIWRRLVESGWSAPVWALAAPLVLLALLMGVWMSGRLARTCRDLASFGVDRDDSRLRGGVVLAWVVWAAAVIVPAGAFAMQRGTWLAVGTLPEVMGEPLLNSVVTALFAALGGLVIAIGTAVGLGARTRLVRLLTAMSAHLWIAMLFLPGVLLGGALAAAAREIHPALAEGRALTVAAHLARFGGVAAILGLVAHAVEPRELADARRMVSAVGLSAWWRSAGRLQAGLLAAAPIGLFALSLHEIEATVIVAPPGPGNLAESLLGKLHYLRDDELSAAGLIMLGSGILLGVIAGACSSRTFAALRRMAPATMLAITALLLAACGRDPSLAEPIRPSAVFGGVSGPNIGGIGDEPTLIYPRAIDSDGEHLWIADKSGWVTGTTLDGVTIARWKLPSIEKGFPVGLTIGPDGLIYIADTHMHRVAVYRPTGDTGELVRTFGELGEGPGQFIYPTDVAIVPASDGVTPDRFYISEYGGNDRVSAFDADGSYLFSFGAPRDRAADGQIGLNRPQSIVYDPARRELIVADSIDHRLGRFTLDGDLIAWIGAEGGAPGEGAGEFRYPYGLSMRRDGTLAVAEFGGCRVQIIDPETGRGLGLYGTPGRGDGQLVAPWGVASAGRDVFVLDSGNNRVMRFRSERAAPGVASR